MNSPSQHPQDGDTPTPHGPSKANLAVFRQAIGRSRFVVILAVVAVLLVALSLFLMGAIMAAFGLWRAWGQVLHGHMDSAELTVQFLEIVSMMLKAVVMYLIGVGLYSLFIEPLNVTVALGVETLGDLESKVVSVVVVYGSHVPGTFHSV